MSISFLLLYMMGLVFRRLSATGAGTGGGSSKGIIGAGATASSFTSRSKVASSSACFDLDGKDTKFEGQGRPLACARPHGRRSWVDGSVWTWSGSCGIRKRGSVEVEGEREQYRRCGAARGVGEEKEDSSARLPANSGSH